MPRFQFCVLIAFLAVAATAATNRTANAQAAPAAAPVPAPLAAQAQAIEQAQQQAALDELLRAQQEAQGGGGGRGGGQVFGGGRGGGGQGGSARGGGGGRRGGTFSSSTNQALLQSLRGGEGAAGYAEDPAAVETKDLVALNLWILTIDMPRAKAADDITSSLVARASDLPTVVGTRDDVRVLIGKLTVAGVLLRCREFRVTAVNGQAVSLQSGANQPQITSSQVLAARGGGRGGGRVNQIQYQSVGTNITFQPRVVAGGNIDVSFTYNSSDQEEAHNVALAEDDDGNRVPATRTVTQQVQTTSRVKGGSAVLVQSDVLTEPTNNDAPSVRTQLIILGANIIPPSAE